MSLRGRRPWESPYYACEMRLLRGVYPALVAGLAMT